MADDRRSVLMRGRALADLGLDDEAVLGGVDIAFEQARTVISTCSASRSPSSTSRASNFSPARTNTTVRFS